MIYDAGSTKTVAVELVETVSVGLNKFTKTELTRGVLIIRRIPKSETNNSSFNLTLVTRPKFFPPFSSSTINVTSRNILGFR